MGDAGPLSERKATWRPQLPAAIRNSPTTTTTSVLSQPRLPITHKDSALRMPDTLHMTTTGLRKRASPYQMAACSIRYKNASIQKMVCTFKFKSASLARSDSAS